MLLLISFVALVSVTFAQNKCNYLTWGNSDFPNTQNGQNFSTITYPPYVYLSHEQFAEGGQYYGQTWRSVVESNFTYFRPLGFRWAQLGPYNDPTVCINVNGVQGYKIELMIQTLTPHVSLCVADMDTDAYASQDVSTGANSCGQGKVYKCFLARTENNRLTVAIWCSENCEDMTEVSFLYRFRRSESRYTNEDDNPEMWCMNIADTENEWPESLSQEIPNDYINQNGNLFAAASTVTPVIAFAVAVLFVLFN